MKIPSTKSNSWTTNLDKRNKSFHFMFFFSRNAHVYNRRTRTTTSTRVITNITNLITSTQLHAHIQIITIPHSQGSNVTNGIPTLSPYPTNRRLVPRLLPRAPPLRPLKQTLLPRPPRPRYYNVHTGWPHVCAAPPARPATFRPWRRHHLRHRRRMGTSRQELHCVQRTILARREGRE